MACTYDYSTGKITLDFHLMKEGEVCRLRGLAVAVGGNGCRTCPFIKGWDCTVQHGAFVKCKHKDAKDSLDARERLFFIYKEFEQEAISHYYD